jgi:CBS-domain-containing membrane protein
MTQCQQIMKRDIACLAPGASVQSAAATMRDQNIGFLPVCDDGDEVLGTVTDRDIAIRAVAENLSPQTAVEDVMTPEVIACRPEDDIEQAQQLMARHHKSRIMCIDRNGHLVGVISLSDLADRFGDGAAGTLRAVSRREARSETRL